MYRAIALLTVAQAVGLVLNVHADESLGRTHAILIGVNDYYRTSSLHYSSNDVDLLGTTLREFSGCDSVYVMSQERPLRDQPDYAKVLGALQDQLRVANNGNYDSLILFFAGHGLIEESSGELYLAPDDFIPNMLDKTCIPIRTIETMLAGCDRVTNKFLVLDTCHSGAKASNRDELKNQPTGDAIAEKLAGAEGLITFSSCQSEETSLEWSDREHGLFTFWFCVGLSGWADRTSTQGPNGVTEVDELHRFTCDMVHATLTMFRERTGLEHEQRPQLICPQNRRSIAIGTAKHIDDPRLPHLLHRARELLLSRRPVEAIELLDDALGLAPADPETLAWRGIAHHERWKKRSKQQDLNTALADLDTSVLLGNYAKRRAPKQVPNLLREDLAEYEQERKQVLRNR